MRVVDHHTAAKLRTLIRRETHAARVRRLQAVLAARDGETAAAMTAWRRECLNPVTIRSVCGCPYITGSC